MPAHKFRVTLTWGKNGEHRWCKGLHVPDRHHAMKAACQMAGDAERRMKLFPGRVKWYVEQRKDAVDRWEIVARSADVTGASDDASEWRTSRTGGYGTRSYTGGTIRQ